MNDTDTQEASGHTAPEPGAQGMNTDHLRDYRRLRRSGTDRKIAGVAGGLGRHLDVDPLVLRVLFVVLVFFGGSGLLLYAALWLFVPDERTERAHIGTNESTRNVLLISALVIAGLLAVADATTGGFPWFLAIVGLVVAAVLVSRDNRRGVGAAPPVDAPAGPGPSSFAVPPTAPASGAGQLPSSGWYPPPGSAVPPPSAAALRTRRGPLLFGATLALLALTLGGLGLLDAAGTPVADAAYPALALTVIGAMLVLGAFWGRAGGLILLGAAAIVALIGTAVSEPTYSGERDLVIRPTDGAAVQDRYRVPAGRIELDLSRVADPSTLDGRSVALTASAGEVVVIVPEDVTVTYEADIAYGGAIDAPGSSKDGWGVESRGQLGAADAEAEMQLSVDLSFGHIQLRQE